MGEAARSQVVAAAPATPPAETISPMAMLQLVVQRGGGIDEISKLMDLADRWQAGNARNAYVAAMAAFKSKPPTILKAKKVSYTTAKGTTEYHHATLAAVCDAIVKALSVVGISHRWITEQADTRIKVTCVLTHVAGHSESTALQSGADDSGGKNSIQAIGSAVTYLQRYTLLAATGLATEELPDDDGGVAGKPEFVPMTQDHQLTIDTKCADAGPGTLERVLKSYKVKTLAEIADSDYARIVKKLDAALIAVKPAEVKA